MFENIRQRLSVVPVGVDVQDQTISPDGKLLLITANAAGQTNLYTYSIDELAREPAVARQLTSTPGTKSNAQFSPDSKEVYYLDAGRPQSITVEERRVRPLDVTAEIDVDFSREKPVVFQQAWRFLNDYFFDAKHNGADWAGVREHLRLARAAGEDAGRDAADDAVDDRRAERVAPGLSALRRPRRRRRSPAGSACGSIRLNMRRAARLRIAEILPLGPAAVTGGIARRRRHRRRLTASG